MIRMGRSSKNDDPSRDTTSLHEQTSTTALQYEQGSRSEPSHAISESESMARDIKEGRLSGFVGAGTVLTGETNFQSMLRVDGHLTGKVSSEEGTLIIGSTGKVDADISVAAAIVNGTVNGDVSASEKLELGRTAKVIGNVSAPRLIVADGAVLEGGCSMIQSVESRETRLEEQRQQFETTDLAPVEVETVEAEVDEEDAFSDSDADSEDDESESLTAAAS